MTLRRSHPKTKVQRSSGGKTHLKDTLLDIVRGCRGLHIHIYIIYMCVCVCVFMFLYRTITPNIDDQSGVTKESDPKNICHVQSVDELRYGHDAALLGFVSTESFWILLG